MTTNRLFLIINSHLLAFDDQDKLISFEGYSDVTFSCLANVSFCKLSYKYGHSMFTILSNDSLISKIDME